MYIILGKIVNFVFFEELEGFSESSKSALYGSLTGVLYKSTRGYRPMIFASFLGAFCGYGYTTCWQRGYFDLENFGKRKN